SRKVRTSLCSTSLLLLHSSPPRRSSDLPEGVEQAERLGERLGGEHFDAIYVTTLRRTVQTAEPLARRLGLEPRVEPGLREVHLGDRKSTRLNSSHVKISYAGFCLKKKKN